MAGVGFGTYWLMLATKVVLDSRGHSRLKHQTGCVCLGAAMQEHYLDDLIDHMHSKNVQHKLLAV